MAVCSSASELLSLSPDFDKVLSLETKVGLIVTAPSDEEGIDCVSRYFAPKYAVPEDAVTGSAHVTIVPYWAQRLGRDEVRAAQISVSAGGRRGDLWCRVAGDRVEMEGTCVVYMRGTITA